MSPDRWQTYLSAQGWVILDGDNQPILNTRSDDTGPEVADIVRRYNELVAALYPLSGAGVVATGDNDE